MTIESEAIDTYDKMNLKSQLVSNINRYGFERPAPLHQRAIAPIIKGKDVIVQAQPDLNMTITLCASILQSIYIFKRGTQAIIISPTRESALEIHKVVYGLSDSMRITSLSAVGGTNIRDDMEKLRRGVHVVSGTPGRIHDMICRNALKTDTVKLVIVHQADVTLMTGFKEQVLEIFQFTDENVQSVFHSLILSDGVLQVTKKYMREPIFISDKSGELSLEGDKQFYVAIPDE